MRNALNGMQREWMPNQMPVEIDGVTYFSVADIVKQVGVSRTTLWRWRQEGKIPAGHRYRNRQILFTAAELQAVREYANKLEPADFGPTKQLGLFNGAKQKEK